MPSVWSVRAQAVLAIFRTLRNWWVPFLYAFRLRRSETVVRFVDGDRLTVSPGDWRCLPSIARLKQRCGIRVEERGRDVRVTFPGGVVFQLTRLGIFWQLGTINEVWDWDEYRLDGLDLSGQVVVDVGGYIGDSALRFASLGAEVHVFEPLRPSREALERNLALSGAAGKRVHLHPVGLATTGGRRWVRFDEAKASFAGTAGEGGGLASEEIDLVDCRQYLAELRLGPVDILKVDCEGCEYDVVGSGAILDALAPRSVRIEYHAGSEPLERALANRSYRVEKAGGPVVGLLFASRAEGIEPATEGRQTAPERWGTP